MKHNRKKMVLLLAAAMLILVCGVGGTLAYLVTQAGPVKNEFTPGKVTSKVNENFNGTTKENVTIKNTGNVSAYIRAAIVVTWKDAQGNKTLPEAPTAGVDYTIVYNMGTGSTQWAVGTDGYYYYNDVVPAGGSTANLINSCSQTKPYDDGRRLCVEIIGSAIQSEGMGATDAMQAFTAAANGN